MKASNIVVHFASETHVDRSILAAAEFIKTDVIGTFVLLEAARGADRLAYSYWAAYGVPVVITRASNNYGPNEWWWRPIKEEDPAFRAYYQTQYGSRP